LSSEPTLSSSNVDNASYEDNASYASNDIADNDVVKANEGLLDESREGELVNKGGDTLKAIQDALPLVQ
jgi:hypothetical protein